MNTNKYKLFESPDYLITLDGEILDWSSDDAYSFGYIDGKMVVSTTPGKPHGEMSGIFKDIKDLILNKLRSYDRMSRKEKIDFLTAFLPDLTLSEIEDFIDNYKTYQDIPEKYLDDLKENLVKYFSDRENSKYSGRIWLNHQYITFWDFPKDYKELWHVLHDIMDAFKKKGMDVVITDDWYIEVVVDEQGNQIPNKYKYWGKSEIKGPVKGYTDKSKIIKIKDYIGSHKFSDAEKNIHLLSWSEKMALKRQGWGRGWGSYLTAWDGKNPLWWRQVKYSENYHYNDDDDDDDSEQTSLIFENKDENDKYDSDNIQDFYKNELNPKFWSKNDVFDEKVRKKLLDIAYDFYNKLKFTTPIIDVILTGSIANYNWSKYSDLDVHIIIDFKEVDENTEIVKKLVDREKQIWNLNHHIRIRGHDVELYVQDVNEKHISSGQYSLLYDKWIIKPVWHKPKINREEVNFKYLTYKSGIDKLEEISKMNLTPEMAKKYYLFASDFKKRIHDKRKIGLSKGGEFSIENLVFKKLRNNGDFGRLKDIVNRFYDKIYIQ